MARDQYTFQDPLKQYDDVDAPEQSQPEPGLDRNLRPHADHGITPYRDGPLLVRGPLRLTDQDGREIAVDRTPVALCRCGRSRIRPFCDGSHRLVRFRAPSGREDRRQR